jgi:hypothetical protein
MQKNTGGVLILHRRLLCDASRILLGSVHQVPPSPARRAQRPPVGTYRYGFLAPQQSAQDRAVASNTAQASAGPITHLNAVGQVSQRAIRASRNSPGAFLTILQRRVPDRRLKMMMKENIR